jgi:hypothetical protein
MLFSTICIWLLPHSEIVNDGKWKGSAAPSHSGPVGSPRCGRARYPTTQRSVRVRRKSDPGSSFAGRNAYATNRTTTSEYTTLLIRPRGSHAESILFSRFKVVENFRACCTVDRFPLAFFRYRAGCKEDDHCRMKDRKGMRKQNKRRNEWRCVP